MANVLGLEDCDITYKFVEIPQNLSPHLYEIFLRTKAKPMLSDSGFKAWALENRVLILRGSAAWLALLDRPPVASELKELASNLYGSLRSIARSGNRGEVIDV